MVIDIPISPLSEQKCKLQPVSGISMESLTIEADLPQALERVSRAVIRLEMELSRLELHLRTAHDQNDQERRVKIQ
jgi:hypothetical protein